MTERRNHIAYYRVSTQKQGQSGLGLEAQQAMVRAFLGDDWPPTAVYTEVESGRKADRPQLTLALAHCKRIGAKLVIAKLDRLARNVAFISNLMEAGVEFVCAENPNVNRLTLHILAAVAEDEARTISQRTKDALTAWKARNPEKRLGNPNGWNGRTSPAGGEAVKRKADEFASRVLPTIRALQDEGLTATAIAARLTERGILTPRGGAWSATQVLRVLGRS